MVDTVFTGHVSVDVMRGVRGVGELLVGVSAFVASGLFAWRVLGACEPEGRHHDNERSQQGQHRTILLRKWNHLIHEDFRKRSDRRMRSRQEKMDLIGNMEEVK